MNATQVEVTCISKKEEAHYTKENPVVTTMELEVPYDINSIYYKLSGGTNFELRTCNQAAADMFTIGKKYMVVIKPVEEK